MNEIKVLRTLPNGVHVSALDFYDDFMRVRFMLTYILQILFNIVNQIDVYNQKNTQTTAFIHNTIMIIKL